MTALWTGFVMGLAVAMPVGPMALYTLEQATLVGMSPVISASLGAALADVAWAILASGAMAGLGAVVRDHQSVLRLASGMVLMAFGLWNLGKIFMGRVHPPETRGTEPRRKSHGPFWVGLLSTGLNPVTLLTFTTFLAHAPPSAQPMAVPPGVFAGGFLWYVFLGGMGWMVGARYRRALGWVRPLSALGFLASGVILALSFRWGHLSWPG